MFLTFGELALVLVPSMVLACAVTVAALGVAVSQQAVPLNGVAATFGAGLIAVGAAAATASVTEIEALAYFRWSGQANTASPWY